MKCRVFYLKHSRGDWLWRPASIKVEIDAMLWLMLQAPSLCLIRWFFFHKLRLNKVMGCFYYKISTKLYYSIAIVHSQVQNKHLTCRTLWPVERCWFTSIQYGTFVSISHGIVLQWRLQASLHNQLNVTTFLI